MWSILNNKTRPVSYDGAICFRVVVLSHPIASAGTTNLSRSGMRIRAANQSTNAGSSGGNRVIYDSDKKVAHRNSCIRIRLSFCLDVYIRPLPVFPSPLSFLPLLLFLIHTFYPWNRLSCRVPFCVASSFLAIGNTGCRHHG